MIIKALHTFNGILDLSTMERLQEGDLYEKYPFRLYMRPGDVVEVDDKFYSIIRIQDAIKLGFIQVGNISVNPNQDQRLVDPSFSGTTMNKIAGEDLSFGDVLYYNADGKVYKAKADAEDTMIAIGMATSDVKAGNATIILISGLIRSSSAFLFTKGSQISTGAALVYVSDATLGKTTQTAPSASGHVVQVLGYAVTEDVLNLKPDNTNIIIC